MASRRNHFVVHRHDAICASVYLYSHAAHDEACQLWIRFSEDRIWIILSTDAALEVHRVAPSLPWTSKVHAVFISGLPIRVKALQASRGA